MILSSSTIDGDLTVGGNLNYGSASGGALVTNFSLSGSVLNGATINLTDLYDPADYQGVSFTISVASSVGARKIGNVFICVDAVGNPSVSDLTTYPVGASNSNNLLLAQNLNFGVATSGGDWRATLSNTVGETVTYAIAVELFATP